MTEALVVLVTVPSRDLGEDIAAKLVTERLAVCVNVLGPVRSVYRWNHEICRDDEHLLVIKTQRERYLALEQRVCALHPYEVPEVIALPVEAGSQAYLSWIFDETR
jgi:periplasmic divalent cation tolerance protein